MKKKDTLRMIDGSKLDINHVSKKELKKVGLVWRKYKTVYNELDKVHRQNMRKYHHCIVVPVIYDWIAQRCILETKKKGWILVFLKDYNKMKKRFATDKISTSIDLKCEKIDYIFRMFAEGNISEC